jgi:hypothetical protein
MRSAIIDLKANDEGPTLALWKDIQADVNDDPRRGMFWMDRFLCGSATLSASGTITTPDAVWTATEATSGTSGIDTARGHEGGLIFTTAATDDAGHQAQGGPTVIPAAGRIIVFETRVKVIDNATGPQFFAGLSIVDTTIMASGANSSTDHIGFESVTDNNILLFHTEDGGTRVSGATSPHTLVASEWVKLGFKIIGIDKCEVWVNGSKVDVNFSATPDICVGTELVTSLACLSAGTTSPDATFDWVALGVYQ